MNICPAKAFDIDSIMMIERASFIPQIQERQKTFEERLTVFPQGFFVYSDTSDETVLKYKKAVNAGYFCSEIWDYIPGEDDFFALGHSPEKLHNPAGKVLYVSSFAVLPQYRGQGNGRKLFLSSLKSVCSAFPSLETVLLLVNDEWKNARKIYDSLGFKTVRTLSNFFPSIQKNSADGILMKAEAESFRQEAVQ